MDLCRRLRLMRISRIFLCGGVLMACLNGAQAKEASLTVTAAQRRNAARNAARYPWARAERDAAVQGAARWLALPDAQLWELVPSQELPRSIHVYNVYGSNKIPLCPQCGKGIIPYGNYPWKTDVFKAPWKIRCPHCDSVFPQNDFGAYYRSALDRHGFFRRGKGDAKLLYNTAHPDPKDPQHTAYVDDGYGWTDGNGVRWDFIAVYAQWGLWRTLEQGIDALARAYTLTDDPAYAHKCGVLLARLADVYPEMDFWPLHQLGFSHSHGGRGLGRVEGSIWECAVAEHWALAYDRIYDALARDRELAAFVNARHQEEALPPTPDPGALAAHISNGLIREIIRGVKDGRINGNQGMHHSALIAAALALDDPHETPALIDWAFAPGAITDDPKNPGRRPLSGGNLAGVLTDIMDRDGLGNEGAPGYSLWGGSLQPAADLLEENARYRTHSIYRDFPKFRQYYLAGQRWSCLDAVTPPIGDSGGTGQWGVTGPNAATLLRAFQVYHDPALARSAWRMLGRDLAGVHGSIFDADPDALRRDVARVVEAPEPPLQGGFLDGWGLAILQTPQRESGRALWLYFGRNTGHGHLDRLNLGLYAENLDLLPDFGYPEFASGRPKDNAWTRNNAAHNVLTVDNAAQQDSYTGHLLAFEPEGKARLVDAASDGIYPGGTTYRRSDWLVDADARNGYVLDVLRARGGSTHTLSWHGPPGEVRVSGLTLIPQAGGSFAGADVPYETLAPDWSRRAGWSFLYNVERAAAPPQYFTVDYRAADTRGRIAAGREPHLRLHNLTPLQEAALADGDPPQNRANAPRRIRFFLATRRGEKLDSTFVTLLEPYDHAPFIKQARRLRILEAAPGVNPVAVEVTLADGRVDTLINCEQPGKVRVEGDILLDGAHAFLARRGEKVAYAKLVEGTLLACGAFRLTAAQAAYTGTITAVHLEDPNDQQLELSAPLPAAAARAGRTIFVANDGAQDAAYSFVSRPGERRVSLGAISLAHGYLDPKKPEKGYRPNVSPGDRYRVPNCVSVEE